MHVQFVIDMLKVFLLAYIKGSTGTTTGSAVRQTLRDFVHGPGSRLLRERFTSSPEEGTAVNLSGDFEHKDFCQSMCGNCVHVRDFWTVLKTIVPETFSNNKGHEFIIAASQQCATQWASDKAADAALDNFWLNSSTGSIPVDTEGCLKQLHESFDVALENDRTLSRFKELKTAETNDILAQAAASINAAYSPSDKILPVENPPVDFFLPKPQPLDCLRPDTPPAQISSDDDEEDEEEDEENEEDDDQDESTDTDDDCSTVETGAAYGDVKPPPPYGAHETPALPPPTYVPQQSPALPPKVVTHPAILDLLNAPVTKDILDWCLPLDCTCPTPPLLELDNLLCSTDTASAVQSEVMPASTTIGKEPTAFLPISAVLPRAHTGLLPTLAVPPNVQTGFPSAADNELANGTGIFRQLLRLDSTVTQAGIIN